MTAQRHGAFCLLAVQAVTLGYHSETLAFPLLVAAAGLYGAATNRCLNWTREQRLVATLLLFVLAGAKYRIAPHQIKFDSLFVGTVETLLIAQFLIVVQLGQFFLRQKNDRLPLWLPAMGAAGMIFASNVRVTFTERFVSQLLVLAYVTAAALYLEASRPRVSAPRMNRSAGLCGGNSRRTTARGQPQPLTRTAPGASLLLDSSGREGLPAADRGGSLRGIVSATVLAAVAGLAWVAATGLYQYEREIERLLAQLMISTRREHPVGFSREARLGSLSQKKTADADKVLLRVFGDSGAAPGYLRGMAFDRFDGQRWDAAFQPRVMHPVVHKPHDIEVRGERGAVFQLRVMPAIRWNRLEIWPDESLEGMLFTRLDTSHVQADVPSLRSSQFLTVECDQLPAGFPYEVYMPEPARGARPWEDPRHTSPTYLERLPGARDEVVQRLAQQLFSGCETTREKILAVMRYFGEHHTYGLDVSPPPGRDPLAWFLRERPPAHCEYFASATVLLLREGGVPCRYVTGLYVDERNHFADYWIARNEDAHAWAEAYDPEHGWIIVESTPSAGHPRDEDDSARRQLLETLWGGLQVFRIRLQQGGLLWLGRAAWTFVSRPRGFLALLVVGAWMTRRLWVRPWKNRASPRDPAASELQRLLRRMDARLRRLHLERHGGETLHQFARRLLAEAPATLDAASVAHWYRQYAAARYGPRPSDAVHALAESMPAVK